MFWAVVFALLASLLFATGAVAQRRSASAVPEDRHGVALVLVLVRQPLWLGGLVADTAGYGAQALAIDLGPLVLVTPFVVTTLLFALPLGAVVEKRAMSASDWAWAVLLTAALAVFVAVADARGGEPSAPVTSWLRASLVLGPLVVGCVLVAGRRNGTRRAAALAVAAGILYGALAAFTKAVESEFSAGLFHLLRRWELFALIGTGIIGTYLQQAAFQAGRLEASLPAATVLEPVAGSVIGVALLHEVVDTGGVRGGLLFASAAVLTVATVQLARSAARTEEPPAAASLQPSGGTGDG